MPASQLASIPVVCLEKTKSGKKEKKVKKDRRQIFRNLHGNYAVSLFSSKGRGALFSGNEKNTRHNNRPVALVGPLREAEWIARSAGHRGFCERW
jgi:hypothetical protein